MDFIPFTALVGVLGVMIGAWLNSFLTTRRERWNLRLKLYTALLEGLNEAKETMQLILVLEVSDPGYVGDSEPTEAATQRREKRKELGTRFAQAVQRVRQTASVAQILLEKNALSSLDKLKREQQDSEPFISYFPPFDRQVRALIRTQRLVVEAARRELGLRRFTDRSLWARFTSFLESLECTCQARNMSDWESVALERWGSAIEWIKGSGPFALVAPCRALTVTLWDSEERAEEERLLINRTGCGGKCNWSLHAIIDLRED